ADNVRLAAYGDETLPRPQLTIERPLDSMVVIEPLGRRMLVEDLAFDATFSTNFDKGQLPDLFHPVGNGGLVVRGCWFGNFNTVVNGNGAPSGVLLMDNELPLETGLRGYFAWIEGANWTILGN